MSQHPDLHTAWARLFVRALAAAGVADLVISPGSRSTPLALAAAAEAALRCHVVVDERAAAFFALGLVRAAGAPAALLCTSGTAGAHYLPAVIEAAQNYLPLVVLTADRPWEAYDAAAPQTVDQVKLFGAHVRHYAELGLPDAQPAALRAVVRIAAQAAHRARHPLPGPVHVNARFRKPLEPVGDPAAPPPDDVAAMLAAGPPAVYAPEARAPEDAVAALRGVLARARRPVIVCGPAPGARPDAARLREAACALARAAGAPLLAEATSGVRFGGAGRGAALVGAFDALLRDAEVRARRAPDVVVELGAPVVSSGYAAWLAAHPSVDRWVVAPWGWNDPLGGARAMVLADPAEVAARVAAALGSAGSAGDAAWVCWFEAAEARAWDCVARELDGDALTEGMIAHRTVAALPAGAVLCVGNSSPVRDLDTYCPPSSRPLAVLHQRGASGIDGLVSGAAGVRAAVDGPCALLLGDLSLLHDLTGLNLLRRARGPLAIVAVQNDGGRIFEQLPLGSRPELAAARERYFATPQGLAYGPAAAQFGLAYEQVGRPAELARALDRALAGEGATLIEAVVPPHDAAARRAALWREVGAAARALGGPVP